MGVRFVATIVLGLAATTGAAFTRSGAQAEYTGIVRAETGSPIEGAVVTALIKTPDHASAHSATTDSDGRYSLGQLAGPAEITVRAQGYSFFLRRLDGPGDVLSGGEITLKRAAVLTGVVTSGGGAPAPAVFVDVVYDATRLAFAPAVDVHGGRRSSGADGRFRIVNVADDVPFLIELVSSGAVIGRFGPFTLKGGATRDMTLTIPPLGRIEGVVEDASYVAVRDAVVRVVSVEGHAGRYIRYRPTTLATRTDGDGRFSFPPSVDGAFSVVVTKLGFKPQVETVSVNETGATMIPRIRFSRQ